MNAKEKQIAAEKERERVLMFNYGKAKVKKRVGMRGRAGVWGKRGDRGGTSEKSGKRWFLRDKLRWKNEDDIIFNSNSLPFVC